MIDKPPGCWSTARRSTGTRRALPCSRCATSSDDASTRCTVSTKARRCVGVRAESRCGPRPGAAIRRARSGQDLSRDCARMADPTARSHTVARRADDMLGRYRPRARFTHAVQDPGDSRVARACRSLPHVTVRARATRAAHRATSSTAAASRACVAPDHRRLDLRQGRHNRLFAERFGSQRLLLACSQLQFLHPQTAAMLTIDAPLAADFARVVTALGWQVPGPINRTVSTSP